MTRLETLYFLDNPKNIHEDDFLLTAKFIGTKRIASGDKFSFIWDNRALSRAGMKRLIELGWIVCDENKKLVPDIFSVIDECPIQFYAE
jgi:hypothetical protein